MKEQMITVIGKRVGARPEVIELENKYEAIRDYIGGFITAVGVTEQVALYCHDEGLLEGLPVNLMYMGMPIVGDVLFIAVDEEGESRSLTDKEVDMILNTLQNYKKGVDSDCRK